MATIDLTRSIFEPRKRYSGVRMQQGRVVLDSDYNDAADVEVEDARRTNRDVVGPSGSPDDGFKVTSATTAAGAVDFTVKAGTMYVGGVPVRLDHDVLFSRQPDWLCLAAADRARTGASTHDLVYLEVWHQPVSAEEDRELAEPALGGPDTTTRLRTMARVRRRSVTAATCSGAWGEVTAQLLSDGLGTWVADTCQLTMNTRLAVSYLPGGTPEDLCSPSVTAGYLGAENQAIRVQLVERLGGVGTGELTWGYDNAAPLYRARRVSATVLELLTPPRDEAHWPILQQTVEVLPWSAVLVPDGNPATEHGEVLADGGGRASPTPEGRLVSVGGGHLARLASSYDPTTRRITLDPLAPLPGTFNPVGASHVAAGVHADHDGVARNELVYVRVWNRGSDLTSAPRIPWVAGSPLTLGNTGLQVTITGSDPNADAHWIIGARPNTPDQVMPWSLEAGRAPNGVRRFLVPLAVVAWSGGTGAVHDCRETFRPLTRQRTCCRYTVGDGEISHGDYTSIQEALDNLPATGGEICVLPGTYDGDVVLDGLEDVTIHGCGAASLVTSLAEAVFTLRGCARVRLDNLGIQSDEGWAVRVDDSTDVTLSGLTVHVRDRGAVYATAVTDFVLRDSALTGTELAADPTEASEIGLLPLVYAQGTRIRIHENRITADDASSPARRVAGGVQIGGDSFVVVVEHNAIAGGNGNGVTLGSVLTDVTDGTSIVIVYEYWYWDGSCLRKATGIYGDDGAPITTVYSAGALEEVRIDENRITGMAGDGIGVAWFFDDADGDGAPDDFITVRQLRVIRNRVTGCATAEREAPSAFLAAWSGHGAIALADVEDGLLRDNELRDNGIAVPDPLCGIFVLNGEGLIVDRNRITFNGRVGATHTGWLGGIVLPLLSPNYVKDAWDGRAAARVVDNVVVAPEGPALLARALAGTVQVERNELTSTTADPDVGLQGIVVDILNGGMYSEDPFDEVTFESMSADRGGQVVFSNNVVNWQPPDMRQLLLWSVMIIGFDDVVCHDNVGRVDLAGGLCLFDWVVGAPTLSVADNRLRETPRRAVYSMLTIGGMNHTADNVTTHCILVRDDGAWTVGVDNRSLVDHYTPDLCADSLPGRAAATEPPSTAGPKKAGLYEERAAKAPYYGTLKEKA